MNCICIIYFLVLCLVLRIRHPAQNSYAEQKHLRIKGNFSGSLNQMLCLQCGTLCARDLDMTKSDKKNKLSKCGSGEKATGQLEGQVTNAPVLTKTEGRKKHVE